MRHLIICLILIGYILNGCTNSHESTTSLSTFKYELNQLKDYYQIPGLAVSIGKKNNALYTDYLGKADLDNNADLDSNYIFPIASLTKLFSSTLIMKLVEDKKLSLDDRVSDLLPNTKINDSILIKHVLSHTSEGEIGKHFHYSGRFSYLTQIIEKASGMSFNDYMKHTIINPLNLENTFLLSDAKQLANSPKKIAKPYILENGIQNGFIDFGYSSSAGLVSNLKDLQKFNLALDNNSIISETSKSIMYNGLNNDLPYSYGIFKQEIESVEILWAYGQYDCYSSLFLKVPSKNLTLILLANNSLLSDPPRLINGDLRSSLFAISFLKNFIFNETNMPILEMDSITETYDIANNNLFRDKLLAQAMSEGYMARYEPDRLNKSAVLLEAVFSAKPNYLEYANLNLLHSLSFLKDVAFYMDLGEFNQFDSRIERIGNHLLDNDPKNPYTNYYLGTYYSRKGDEEKAKQYFETIIKSKNYTRNWYTQEAEQWIKNSLTSISH